MGGTRALATFSRPLLVGCVVAVCVVRTVVLNLSVRMARNWLAVRCAAASCYKRKQLGAHLRLCHVTAKALARAAAIAGQVRMLRELMLRR
jgi:hypothetical protein